MYKILEQRLAALHSISDAALLAENKIGLEKESLRVNKQGSIAQTPHPEKLGSPLTHPYITTDYSEALLEMITPPLGSASEVLSFLRDTHKFVYENLVDELLWATSMPCVVAGDSSIPIAQYGSSNAGIMKTVYRKGLGHRYGKVMQVISGVHFNFSIGDTFWQRYQDNEKSKSSLRLFKDEHYFCLIRNLQRFGWLVPYLFGASPAVCKSFVGDGVTTLESFDQTTYYEPWGTSLRMGDIGYQNNKEKEFGIKACYRELDSYIRSLTHAIETPHKAWQDIGVVVNGIYEQLNPNILQIENEYYSTIRPKQVLEGNEKPTLALKKRGVRYVELRSLDVNAFEPLGVNEQQLHFLEAFLLFCLLHDSPPIELQERSEIDYNEMITAHRGRKPGLNLRRHKKAILLMDWAREVLENMQGVCELLDKHKGNTCYTDVQKVQLEKVMDPDRTPSAIMLETMRQDGEGFFRFAERLSKMHQHTFTNIPLDETRRAFFRQQAEDSKARQQKMEAGDRQTFSEYLEAYFSQK